MALARPVLTVPRLARSLRCCPAVRAAAAAPAATPAAAAAASGAAAGSIPAPPTSRPSEEDLWKEKSRLRRQKRKDFKPEHILLYRYRRFMNNLATRKHAHHDIHPSLPTIPIPSRVPSDRFLRLREVTQGLNDRQWLRPELPETKLLKDPFFMAPVKGRRQQYVTSGGDEVLAAVYTTEWYEPYYLHFFGGAPATEKAQESGWNWNPSETNLDRKRREAILESFQQKFGAHDYLSIAQSQGFQIDAKNVVAPVVPVVKTAGAGAQAKGKKKSAAGAAAASAAKDAAGGAAKPAAGKK
jgi:hypothetical protein